MTALFRLSMKFGMFDWLDRNHGNLLILKIRIRTKEDKMSQILLELPDGYTQQLKAVAAIRQKSMEDIILDAVRKLIDGNVPQDLSRIHGRKQWMSFAGMLDESEADELLEIIQKNRINKNLEIRL